MKTNPKTLAELDLWLRERSASMLSRYRGDKHQFEVTMWRYDTEGDRLTGCFIGTGPSLEAATYNAMGMLEAARPPVREGAAS